MPVVDETVSFKVEKDQSVKAREILKEVYNALLEKGYNPINQIVGYILSGDPTYITSHNNARNLIRQIERDELLERMVKNYIGLDEQDMEAKCENLELIMAMLEQDLPFQMSSV